MKQQKKPLVVLIDIEPIPHHAVRGTPGELDHVPAFLEQVDKWRQQVTATTGHPLRVSWALRVDDQMTAYGSTVALVDRFGDLLRSLRQRGDEIGFHPHAYRWDVDQAAWRNDYEDAVWLEGRLESWFADFRASLGHTPDFFRFGDRWLSQAVVGMLERKGVAIDLTLEPGRPGGPAHLTDFGEYPDYTDVPRQPYRPAPGNFLEKDGREKSKLWMMPVSMACVANPLNCSGAGHDGHHMEHINIGMQPTLLRPFVDAALATSSLVTVVGRTGDAFNPADNGIFWANWEYLFTHPLLTDFVTEPPKAAFRRYRTNRSRLRQLLHI